MKPEAGFLSYTTVTMKPISEAIGHFWQGFLSFYTLLYRELKSW